MAVVFAFPPNHPGVYIRDELKTRRWTQRHLAAILDISPQYLNQIIKGQRDISLTMAVALGAAFGTSARFWSNLDFDYRISKVDVDEDAIRARSAKRKERS